MLTSSLVDNPYFIQPSAISELTTGKFTEWDINVPYDHCNNLSTEFVAVIVNGALNNVNNPFFFCRIVMRNFLRIRDGDRFWYERYLSQEVLICTYLVQKLQRFTFMGPDHLRYDIIHGFISPSAFQIILARTKTAESLISNIIFTFPLIQSSRPQSFYIHHAFLNNQRPPKHLLHFPWVSLEQYSSEISTVSLKNEFAFCRRCH